MPGPCGCRRAGPVAAVDSMPARCRCYGAFVSTARHLRNAYADYLLIEEHSNVRHEFIGGEIYAMAGGTPEHGALAFRVMRLLEDALTGCTPFSSDVRVRIDAAAMTTYPDGSFVCGAVERSSVDSLAVVNPTLLVEVTSPTTEGWDRNEKLAAYQQLPALKAVVFVSHRSPVITVVERDGGRWVSRDFEAGSHAEVASLRARVSVDAVYDVLRAVGAGPS